MKIADIIDEYYDAFLTRYEDRLLPGHLKALNAMRYCRSAESGELFVQCPNCDHRQWRPLSCGHRSCLNAKTTKRAAGSTVNRTNCCPSLTSW